MTIKAIKCHLFGIYEKGTTSRQYKLKLYFDNVLVPPAKFDDCFTTQVVALISKWQMINIK